jgi:hypothetical protein
LGERRVVQVINGGENSIDLENITQIERPSTSMEGWNTTWIVMKNNTLHGILYIITFIVL